MIELAKYFRILFLSARISRSRLKDFTEDHIQRLTANNPAGIFTTILTNVSTAYNTYYGDMASESVNQAVQEGKTVAMNESRTVVETFISEGQGLIDYTYRNNRSVYEEFFPRGMEEYYQASISEFETITDRFKSALAAHSGDFTGTFVADFTSLQATFVANRAAQLTAKGNVAAERSDMATTRPALAFQLTTNLLTIALQYLGDESKADVYFNQAILDAAFREGARKVEADINPATTENIFDDITQPDVRLVIENIGIAPTDADLDFGFGPAANTVVTNKRVIIGNEVSFTVAELGWTTDNRFFNVTNASGSAGSYKVRKV